MSLPARLGGRSWLLRVIRDKTKWRCSLVKGSCGVWLCISPAKIRLSCRLAHRKGGIFSRDDEFRADFARSGVFSPQEWIFIRQIFVGWENTANFKA